MTKFSPRRHEGHEGFRKGERRSPFPIFFAFALAVLLSITWGCAAVSTPNLLDELQNKKQLQSVSVPTELTDLGVLRYGEKVLASWGLRSQGADVLGATGALTLAGLSTGALASAGNGAAPGTITAIVASFNFILQALGILRPAERNDARHEGASMILDARGAFLEALAAKHIYHISNRRFTPQGALYFKQIGAAIKIVDRLIVGLAPRMEDLQKLQPVPVNQQPDPGPEPPAVSVP